MWTIGEREHSLLCSKPFTSYRLPRFQINSCCTTVHMELSLSCKIISRQEKSRLNMKGFAPSLVFKQRKEKFGNYCLKYFAGFF